MMKFLLWCILLVLCWPLALLALVLYPLVWLLLLPFRLVGIAVDGALESGLGAGHPARPHPARVLNNTKGRALRQRARPLGAGWVWGYMPRC